MKVNAKQFVNTLARISKDAPKQWGVIVTDEHATWLRLSVCDDHFNHVEYVIEGSGQDSGHRSCRIGEWKKLLAWTKAIKAACQDEIEITVTPDEKVSFQYRSKILTLNKSGMVQDCPVAPNLRMPPFDKCVLQGMTYADLAKWGKPLLACASDDSTRPYLYGIAFHPNALTATDGHRMSILNLTDIGVQGITDNADAFVLPTHAFERMVEEAAAMKDILHPPCNIFMSISAVPETNKQDAKTPTERWIVVQFGNATRYIKIDEATPPPYDFLNSLAADIVFTPSNVDDLVSVCNEVKVLIVPAKIAIGAEYQDGAMHVTYENYECSYADDVRGTWNKAFEWTTGWNVQYLLDAVQQFQHPVLCLTDALSAMLVKEDGNPFRTYVMPIRT